MYMSLGVTILRFTSLGSESLTYQITFSYFRYLVNLPRAIFRIIMQNLELRNLGPLQIYIMSFKDVKCPK